MNDALTVIGGPCDLDDMFQYPFGHEDRLDSHYFVAWERRRWLNSDMCLRGTPECKSHYLDLIWISYDQSPVGTLPEDPVILAKLLRIDQGHLEALMALPFGPLHGWRPCLCDGGERRLYHGMVLRSVQDAMSRREDNRARNEAANTKKRLQRLRSTVMGYHKELGQNDAAVLWMDGWLVKQQVGYRNADWIERAIQAWSTHSFDPARVSRMS